MAEQPSSNLMWVLDVNASSDEVAAVSQIAHEEGLPGPVNSTLSYKSIEDVPWWTILIVFANFTFLKGFLDEAGRDSYRGLHRLVSRLFGARRNEEGTVRVKVESQITMIVFTSDLPEEAFSMIADLDLDNIEGKYIYWESGRRRWEMRGRKSCLKLGVLID